MKTIDIKPRAVVTSEQSAIAYLNGVRVGRITSSSEPYRDAISFATRGLRAIQNKDRIKHLEKRIRNARAHCFCTGGDAIRNVGKMKRELLARRSKFSGIDVDSLMRELVIDRARSGEPAHLGKHKG